MRKDRGAGRARSAVGDGAGCIARLGLHTAVSLRGTACRLCPDKTELQVGEQEDPCARIEVQQSRAPLEMARWLHELGLHTAVLEAAVLHDSSDKVYPSCRLAIGRSGAVEVQPGPAAPLEMASDASHVHGHDGNDEDTRYPIWAHDSSASDL